MDKRQTTSLPAPLARAIGLIVSLLLLAGCSTGQMVVRGSQTILDSGVVAMNSETDLELARTAMPANLKLIEGMLLEDPGNVELLLFAAQGFYGYSYGFIETEDTDRAGALYRRCLSTRARPCRCVALISTRRPPHQTTSARLSPAPARTMYPRFSGLPPARENG